MAPDLMGRAPKRFTDPDALADAILEQVGPRIVLGLPLGLGKAPHIANALYRRAARNPSISLRIFTALTLEPPPLTSEFERRFLGPVFERTMGGYPRLAYAEAQRKDALPPNIEVDEFFFQAGTRLDVPSAQQSYISANYTHASRYLIDRGVNVIAQLVAERGGDEGRRYSLSCNTDMTCDLLALRRAGKADFLLVGQVNGELPYMKGDTDLGEDCFAFILEGKPVDFPLFGPPKRPLEPAHHAIGVHVASLMPDGGTIQLGIGELGDAVAHALILRHRHPKAFGTALSALGERPDTLDRHDAPFDLGLHAVTEMVADCFLDLIRAGVVKRAVDDAVLYGGFFLGPRAFYAALRDMDEAERDRIAMRGISFINELYGDEDAKRAARVGARFVNSTMMVTLLGAAVSDQLEDGRVVSGVGGQYNFVAQAFALEDGRSIITLPATRMHGGDLRSNIVWSYGHATVPRHLRDIVVTEYGIADLRGATDARVIERLLAVADSRFQPALLAQAKNAGKIARNYEIPEGFRGNRPDRVAGAISDRQFPAFPFGTDFTDAEQRLIPAMKRLKAAATRKRGLFALAASGLRPGRLTDGDEAALRRMSVEGKKGPKEKLFRLLLRGALRATGQNR